MKRKLIIGSILAVSILMMIPTISAVEADIVIDTQDPIWDQIPELNIEELLAKYDDNPDQPQFIITLLINLLRVIRGALFGLTVLLESARLIILLLIALILKGPSNNTTAI